MSPSRTLPMLVLVLASLGLAAGQVPDSSQLQDVVEAQGATSPAHFHPGFLGGGIYYGGKLCCSRTTCPPNWTSTCNGLKLAECRKLRCQSTTASDGAVCDVNPCVQGTCWKGICMGGGPPTCPDHHEECMQYKCNPQSGECTESCPKPNGYPCWGGTCQSGKCQPSKYTCPPNPNKCSSFVFNNTTMLCNLVNTTCQLPPNTCKELGCNPNTGLCTVVTTKPDNTSCSGGSCQRGECLPDQPTCPATCPKHPNPCKAFGCNTSTGKCTRVVIKPDNTTCPGGTCVSGFCKPAIKCPATCPALLNPCKERQCDLTTGICSVIVDKPDNTTCPTGTCQSGLCKPVIKCPASCPPHRLPCKERQCDVTTGRCSIVVNKPNNFTCSGGTCQAGVCEPLLNCPTSPNTCQRNEPAPDGNSCITVNVTDSTTCNDNNKCTLRDTCAGGVCAGIPKVCTQPANECQVRVCDPADGICKIQSRPDNTSCSGTDKCSDYSCQAGSCVAGPAKNCSAEDDDCNVGTCDATTGSCVKTPRTGTNISCSTGLYCTVGQVCSNGVCGGGRPRVCNSTKPCETLQCNAVSKACDIVVPKAVNATCKTSTPCFGLCSATGECVEDCNAPPGTCAAEDDCGSNQCCCDGKCVASENNDCSLTCANIACQKSNPNGVCACIHDCDGDNCNSALGNPCTNNGVCCCNNAPAAGKLFIDACTSCKEPCSGVPSTCTGDYPPCAICSASIDIAA